MCDLSLKSGIPRNTTKQPVQKVGWAVLLFVSLVGLFDSEFFVFFFQRYSFLKGVAVEAVTQDNG